MAPPRPPNPAARSGSHVVPAELLRAQTHLLDAAHDAILLWELGGGILFWNRGAEELYGWSRTEALGRSSHELFATGNIAVEEIDRALAEEGLWEGELLHRTRHGRDLLVESRQVSLWDDTGRRLVLETNRDVTARREAEQSLRQSEAEFRAMFELSSVSAAQVDPVTQRFVRVNLRFCALTGYTERELLGLTFAEITHPDDREADAAIILPVLRGERDSWYSQKRYVRRDGGVVWVEVRGTLLRNTAGAPERTLALIEDVTERRRREDTLRQNEERYRLALDAGRMGAWDWDIPGNRVVWSDRLYEFHGLEPGSFAGTVEAFAEVVHPEDRERAQRTIEHVLRTGDPYELEFRTLRPDGSIRWLLTTGRVLFGDDGLPVRMLGLTLDITARRRAEDALRSRAEELSLLVDLGTQALGEPDVDAFLAGALGRVAATMQDVDVTFTEYLRETERLRLRAGTGWAAPPHELEVHPAEGDSQAVVAFRLGQPILSTDIRTDSRFRAHPLLLENGVVSSVTVVVPGPRGPAGVLGVHSTVRREFTSDEAQFLQSVAGLISLALERGGLESELRRRVAELATADREKDEFLAMLAHELRNPLAPIVNAVEVLRLRGPQDPALQRQRDIIERQARHLARMVDDLLEVSRVSRGKVNLRLEPVDLVTLADQAAASVRPLMQQRQHSLTVSLPPGPVMVHGDPTRVTQVLTNLLNNAAWYTDPGGAVELVLEADGAHATVRVRDNGRGIAPDLLPRVWDLFVQGERSLARTEGGLGVGLTLVKHLVELHDGAVEAHSAGPGLGAEFVVRLPVLPAAQPSRHASPAAAGDLAEAPGSVLVVEDNPDAAETLAVLLEAWGLSVRVAPDGVTALSLAAESHPEVVLLDLGLPGMDGYTVARQLREACGPRRVRLVALTGYGRGEDRRRAEEAGFDHFLTKPVDPVRLRLLLGNGARAEPA